MNLTNDQYSAFNKLNKWYRKYNQQFISISGVVGTGVLSLIQHFFEYVNISKQEAMYLSFNQKQVLDLAFQKYHAYHLTSIIYNYIKMIDFDTLPVVNRYSREVKYEWKKDVRKKVDRRYKIIVVFDSTLLNHQTINDLSTFGIPVILISDPMLLPAPDTYMFAREPNIELYEPQSTSLNSPIVYFAHKIINQERIDPGNYDTVTVIPKKQLNLYNLKSSDMNITLSDAMMIDINKLYREKILKRKDNINVVNERVIVDETLYNRSLNNQDNEKVKIFLTKGVVGNLSKVNKHAQTTKYVGVNFKPEFYHEEFTYLMMDRYHLNGIDTQVDQLIPDEVLKVKYAYALSAAMSRLSYWDKVTLILDESSDSLMRSCYDPELQRRLMYTGITRAKKYLNIVM